MKPIYQTKFGPTEGNCLAACVASLLEIEIDQVPDLTPRPEDKGTWTETFRKFFKWYGIHPEWYTALPERKIFQPPPGVNYLVWGTSPRGLPHSVIYRNGQMIHDPHPEGGGVDPITEVVVFFKTFD